ncbi:MAG: heavy-metal-associated domain-containing protein [Hoeflea sp.]|uniref:heavy-metal-associated domain-containing protein n=1 Tax=Hoeflea sp. TaxID=1940281 RepID=UPI001D6BE218|nr:heavy metal-associated domain-containing protein [Hoeflea sp.]MBV1725596.1 heavy-metal-associated domain-containing protein [Hoeflea sp.]MBV1759644.1 heavy-metal-associated domain-containing protein [Hoeflea sp.]MBV1782137.1 heavy-metal-associated domain-containing protein [Hoeflea sp.]
MTITLKIVGMHCGGCVRSVEKVAQALDGVSNVSVSLENAELTADVASPDRIDALKSAIEDCGFEVTGAPA